MQQYYNSGIGGVRKIDYVKCFHSHYANYMQHGNDPVGEMIHKEIKNIIKTTCLSPCVVKDNTDDYIVNDDWESN